MDLFNKLLQRVNNSIKDRINCHCIIAGADNKQLYSVIGTGILLEYEEKLFIVTAAHVIDHNEYTTLYTFLNNQTIELTGDWELTLKPNNERRKDKIDFAFHMLDSTTSQTFKSNYKPLQIHDILFNEIPNEKKYYTFFGFPTSKNKPRYMTDNVRPAPYSYSNYGVKSKIYKDIKYDPMLHKIIYFEKKNNGITFPQPEGMSGGSVWLSLDFDVKNGKSNIFIDKLVGIGISYNKNPSLLIGIKIDIVIQSIKDYLEKLKYLDSKVDL